MHATATVAVLSFSPLAFWHFGIINRNDLAHGAKASTTQILATKDYKKVLAVYGKVAYFELSSHQISELKQQAKRENIHLAKISEMLAN